MDNLISAPLRKIINTTTSLKPRQAIGCKCILISDVLECESLWMNHDSCQISACLVYFVSLFVCSCYVESRWESLQTLQEMALKFHVMEIPISADSLPGPVNHITFLFEFSTFFLRQLSSFYFTHVSFIVLFFTTDFSAFFFVGLYFM